MEAVLAAIGLVFVAELGDKTQLVALGLGGSSSARTGVALAYALTNLVSVVVGGVLGAALPTTALGLGAGILFPFFAG